jgi:hypothetical protein
MEKKEALERQKREDGSQNTNSPPVQINDSNELPPLLRPSNVNSAPIPQKRKSFTCNF